MESFSSIEHCMYLCHLMYSRIQAQYDLIWIKTIPSIWNIVIVLRMASIFVPLELAIPVVVVKSGRDCRGRCWSTKLLFRLRFTPRMILLNRHPGPAEFYRRCRISNTPQSVIVRRPLDFRLSVSHLVEQTFHCDLLRLCCRVPCSGSFWAESSVLTKVWTTYTLGWALKPKSKRLKKNVNFLFKPKFKHFIEVLIIIELSGNKLNYLFF